MKGKSKWFLMLSLVFVLSIFLSACGGSGSGSSKGSSTGGNGGDNGTTSGKTGNSNKTRVFHFYSPSEIPTMDTVKGDDEESFNQYTAVFEGLYTMNNKGKIVPAEAKGKPDIKPVKVTVTNDKGKKVQKTYYNYTFHLRDGLKWSNGNPVTAQDYVFAWKRLVSKEAAATYSYLEPTLGIENAAKILDKNNKKFYGKTDKLGVKAIDDKTLQMTLVKKVPDHVLYSLMMFPSFFPQPKDFVKKEGKNYALEPNEMLYNGPYVMTQWNHNEGWTYEKNPKYWDKANVQVDKITDKVVKQESTRVNLYNTGKLDIVGLTSKYVTKYKNKPDFHTRAGTAVYYFTPNLHNKYLKNKNIRKALAMSWNKKKFTNVLLNNGSIPAWYLVPKDFVKGPNGKDFRAQYGDLNSYNPKKAKQLWEKGLKQLGVSSVHFKLLAYPGDIVKQNITYVISQWEQNLPGLKIDLNQQPFKVMLSKEHSHNFDLAYGGWGPDYQGPMTFIDLFVKGGSENNGFYENPQYDKLVNFAQNNPQDPSRWAKMQKAEKILISQDQAILPMYQKGSAYLLSSDVTSFAHHAFGPDYTWKFLKMK